MISYFFEFRSYFLALILLSVSSCTFLPPKYSMDDTTAAHPATKRFIAFAQKAKTTASYEDLLPEFYTPNNQQSIPKLIGWYRLAYSSPYETLKDGDCHSIELKPAGSRVQIDCIGSTIVPSLILGDRELPVHLRVFLTLWEGEWYFDRSGFVTIDNSIDPAAYGRGGIKFVSELEQ